jgi:uncharacterized repeat protein (TIGR01451 family)
MQLRLKSWWRRVALTSLASTIGIIQLPLPGIAQTTPDRPSTLVNTARYQYKTPAGAIVQAKTNLLSQPLVDPSGIITGCGGELLPDYRGFTSNLYFASASGLDLAGLVPLTRTEFPDIPNNGISAGSKPNTLNANPYFVQNDGRYSFLLDEGQGQLEIGKTYILVINAPTGSNYAQRRIRIVLTGRVGNVLSYEATAIDGKPLSLVTGEQAVNGTVRVANADANGLSIAALNFAVGTCDAQDLKITKSGDRATAEPGDTVIYRLSVRSLARAGLNNISLSDVLPRGFSFLAGSVKGELAGTPVNIVTTQAERNVTFTLPDTILPPASANQVLNIVYAAQLTPDAVRGDGQNVVSVAGRRVDNQRLVQDGPAIYKMRVRSGLLSDCGTIIGRVFIDKNADGEQQAGEPGVPNAVILLDDGNRITTDANGLYSVANVLAGQRTGVLDATSIPGLTLAPNPFVRERNSQSRLVNLAPGGLVRMNFAVTPAAKKEAEPCNCK